MTRILHSITLLYALMLIPAWPLIIGLFDDAGYYPQLMYDSGLWAVYFLIITIAVSPMLLLINRIGVGTAFGRWLLKRRRHFGLATAIYASLHLGHYLAEADDVPTILAEMLAFKISVGWIAFLIMAVLAVTSNNTAIRKLGRRWKTLHNWIYPAAALTFLHWYLFDWYTARVMFWVGVFCAVKVGHRLVTFIPRQA